MRWVVAGPGYQVRTVREVRSGGLVLRTTVGIGRILYGKRNASGEGHDATKLPSVQSLPGESLKILSERQLVNEVHDGAMPDIEIRQPLFIEWPVGNLDAYSGVVRFLA